MNIKKITVLTGSHGPDKVMLHTDLVEACYPYQVELMLDFNCAAGKGRSYALEHFPTVMIELIDLG